MFCNSALRKRKRWFRFVSEETVERAAYTCKAFVPKNMLSRNWLTRAGVVLIF